MILIQKLFDYINMNTLANVEEWLIINNLCYIRRIFALNETFHLKLNPNMLFVIASYHDVGKYIDHKKHHLIAAEKMCIRDSL